MKSDTIIEVKNVKKKFKVYHDKSYGLKERVLFAKRNQYEERWVINGISFDVKRGQAIGLIGKNGCGKSTLLKLINRIIYPTEGEIVVKGRVSSLLELGAGFHPDMSGRENIYTNASIFGLTKKEINERIGKIIQFSELEEFIDCPVRTYSSGMYMRLAFSVAINVDADILLIDEILAVGDVSFQAKCFERLKEIKAKGTTIVLVSHSSGQIEQICDRAIWIDQGVIRKEGPPHFIGEAYLASMETERLGRSASIREIPKEDNKKEWCLNAVRSGNSLIKFIKVKMQNAELEETQVFVSGEKIIIHMEYVSQEAGLMGNFGVGISRDDGVYCYGTNTIIETGKMVLCDLNGSVDVILDNPLLPAKYILDVAIHTEDEIPFDKIHHILEFRVISAKKDFGVCRLDNRWFINNQEMVKENSQYDK